MKAAYIWMLVLAGCCHERPAAKAADEVAAARLAGSGKRCHSGCALALTMRQLSQRPEMVLEFSLMNVSHERVVWVASSPRVGTGHSEFSASEIAFHLSDHNSREVVRHCTGDDWPSEPPVYVALPPGQAVTATVVLAADVAS